MDTHYEVHDDGYHLFIAGEHKGTSKHVSVIVDMEQSAIHDHGDYERMVEIFYTIEFKPFSCGGQTQRYLLLNPMCWLLPLLNAGLKQPKPFASLARAMGEETFRRFVCGFQWRPNVITTSETERRIIGNMAILYEQHSREHDKAAQVGHYIPMDDDYTVQVPLGLLRQAHETTIGE